MIDEVFFGCREFALTLLAAFYEFALVTTAIWELVHTFTMRQVFEPLANVIGIIRHDKFSLSTGHKFAFFIISFDGSLKDTSILKS